jgi:thioredoxin reductase (NADPH)
MSASVTAAATVALSDSPAAAAAAAPAAATTGTAASPHNVVIVGSGPAAHTAAIYAARAGLAPTLYEGFMANDVAAGGQLTTTTDIENFPGFENGINGLELTEIFARQSKRFGTIIHSKTVSKLDLSSRPFRLWCEGEESAPPVHAASLIIATGASPKKLDVPGASYYWQKVRQRHGGGSGARAPR